MADIEATGLVKRYGALTAVDDVSFSVEKGEIFGVLGPNGAGKTTTLEILEGLRDADGGNATVLGFQIGGDARALKQRIGVQLQATALPQFIRVREAIELFGAFYERSRPADELLEQFNLTEKAKDYADKLSGGQLQRLSIALALVNNPDLVFLDEPTTGLDPQARLNLWAVIADIRSAGRTVMLTTHYMDEAERLCDRVAVMDGGRIVALDTPSRLIAEHAAGTSIEFEAPGGVDADVLGTIAGIDRVTVDGRVTVHTQVPERVLRDLLDPDAPWLRHGPGEASGVRDLLVRSGTLEDVFINLTGRGLRT